MLDLAIISEEILVGSQIVTEEDLDTLKKLGVVGILSLQETRDMRDTGVNVDSLQRLALARGMELRRCPVRDFDAQDLIDKLDRCTSELQDLVRECGRVYVHCTAGIQRSIGVVLAYLVLGRHMTVDAAYRLVKSRRPEASPYRPLLDELSARWREGRFLPATTGQ